MDTVTLVNLILSVTILIMGIWAYSVDKVRSILYVGIAFGFFALTHLLSLVGLAANLFMPILIIRLAGYLLVIYANYVVIAKKKNT